MAKKLNELGYTQVTATGIWSCLNLKCNQHAGFHFKSVALKDFKEVNSPIRFMNLLDLLEMFFDWKAASERHANGNIMQSIRVNSERFGMTEQLVDIFEATVKYCEEQGIF